MFTWFLPSFLFLALNLWPFGTGRPNAEIKKTSIEIPKGAEVKQFEIVKISLGTVPSATIATTASYKVLDKDGRPLFTGLKMAPTQVKATANGIQLGSQNFSEVPLTILTDNVINVNGKPYRRAAKLWKEGNNLLIVNEIAMEDYLKGVLPKEASASWPMEALKTQAIASRTYALFQTISKKDQKFSMSKDVLSQVYGGKESEHELTNQAVESTRGQVVTHGGKLFPAYFHSTCGGKTTHAEYAWDVEPNKALNGTDCNFCWSSKHYRWNATFTSAEILKRLKIKGVKMGEIRDIQIGEMDKSGRARSFIVVHDQGQIKFHSNDFRIWMDPMKFKSTLIISIDKTKNGFAFRGKGWGHGVGVCQFGMRQLAKLGYTSKQILEYYYPGAEVMKIQE